MKRVIVIGCPGSGKSTFSRALSRALGLPLIHLDNIWWKSDGRTVSREEFDARLTELLSTDEWIIDGNYKRTMERRMAACDSVIFLDLPLEICLEGIRERKGMARPDMPWRGASDSDDAEFIARVEAYGEKDRPYVLELLEKYKDRNIIIIKSRDEAEEFCRAAERKDI